MLFYKLAFDMDYVDESIKTGASTIYAEATNMDEIVYHDIKKGFFDKIILTSHKIEDWPNVEFYYSSKASNIENDYLINIKRWPIIHKKVMNKLVETKVRGVEYYPIKLVDIVTNQVNENYVLMYTCNFIDAYDMEKSQYKYNEKYDFYTFIPNKTFMNYEVCSDYDIFRCSKNPYVLG